MHETLNLIFGHVFLELRRTLNNFEIKKHFSINKVFALNTRGKHRMPMFSNIFFGI